MESIVASVLDADFSRWKKWLGELDEAGVKSIQWDIMDNEFVKNTGVDKSFIPILRAKTKMFFESHLMVSKPENYVEEFSSNGTELLIFHVEAAKEPLSLIEAIEEQGLKVGLAIDLETSEKKVFPFLDKVDLILVMGVKAGFGGQSFQTVALEKIASIKSEIVKYGLDCEIEVDGGINAETGKLCNKAGADKLVVGSFLFKNPFGIKDAVRALREGVSFE